MTSNQSVRKPKAGVFIDGSNLLWAVKMVDADGRKIHFDISYKKLKDFLEERYDLKFCNYYCCEDNTSTSEPYISRSHRQKVFHNILEKIGYHVVRKDLKRIQSKTKCDTDVEIVMDMHKMTKEIDTMILFSGDSDFRAAVEHFHTQGKSVHVYSFSRFLSWELKEFTMKNKRCEYYLLDELKNSLILG